MYVEEITFTKSKLIEIVNHSKPSIIGLKIIVIFWTLFALVFFINIWLNFIGYINKSTKTYGTVISVMNASANSYFNNLEILYQGKSYPTKLESSKKYNVGEQLYVYFNPNRSHEVELVYSDLWIAPLTVSVSLIVLIIFAYYAITNPNDILDKIHWGVGGSE